MPNRLNLAPVGLDIGAAHLVQDFRESSQNFLPEVMSVRFQVLVMQKFPKQLLTLVGGVRHLRATVEPLYKVRLFDRGVRPPGRTVEPFGRVRRVARAAKLLEVWGHIRGRWRGRGFKNFQRLRDLRAFTWVPGPTPLCQPPQPIRKSLVLWPWRTLPSHYKRHGCQRRVVVERNFAGEDLMSKCNKNAVNLERCPD